VVVTSSVLLRCRFAFGAMFYEVETGVPLYGEADDFDRQVQATKDGVHSRNLGLLKSEVQDRHTHKHPY
jgi:hypothetical protein